MEKTRVDLSYLETFTGGDNTLITEMMERFLIDAPEQLNEITESIQAEDWKYAYKRLHNFKSSVNFLAIQSIKDLVLEMEKMAKEERNVTALPEKYELLSGECELLMEEIRTRI
ncbi:Hpt domain-containing protein [Flammeovirga kamogawensis]|uniref:Hpt domain-containing protein n=1 Tax=Flammeovirga kamogawensis TaxID=373891 RepID=A0ABX8GZW5_9BACT|nr:Hpt domain-containing protein [Flammeovirga kamogawensis]MBB6459550.1 HPt (histidine-containing phosphotransfer) domain-containing protein [Flammeovirga kamogawensis]QWG09101.1 Hpt domain-containing protein [Flammeovirga kamogawensis]TRX67389.1 hypothetical protein EO216_04225 [Flammeovirga kamogawensis]